MKITTTISIHPSILDFYPAIAAEHLPQKISSDSKVPTGLPGVSGFLPFGNKEPGWGRVLLFDFTDFHTWGCAFYICNLSKRILRDPLPRLSCQHEKVSLLKARLRKYGSYWWAMAPVGLFSGVSSHHGLDFTPVKNQHQAHVLSQDGAQFIPGESERRPSEFSGAATIYARSEFGTVSLKGNAAR